MEDYFLKDWWKCNNECSIVPVFSYNRIKKILRLLHMNLLLLGMGKCRHHLILQDLIWMVNIIVWNYLQTKIVIISAIRFAVFSCDQAALWMVFSVCLSVRLSVTPFWLCSHHRIIMKFSGVITTDQGNVHAKGQGQRSKVKVTEVATQLSRFRTVTPVWIHKWWWNNTYSLMLLRRGALLFFKVIRQVSRSHGAKNRRIWPRLGISGL